MKTKPRKQKLTEIQLKKAALRIRRLESTISEQDKILERQRGISRKARIRFPNLVDILEPVTDSEHLDFLENLLLQNRLVPARWVDRAVSLWEILEEMSNRERHRERLEDCRCLFAKRDDNGRIEWTSFPSPSNPFIVPRKGNP